MLLAGSAINNEDGSKQISNVASWLGDGTEG